MTVAFWVVATITALISEKSFFGLVFSNFFHAKVAL